MKNVHADTNQRLLDQLLAQRRLTTEAHATITAYVTLHGGRVEDAIIENEILPEAELLRLIATAHNTRFVSTEKLYKAAIDPKLLNLIPRKLADQFFVLPVMYDDARRALSVVTADPDNLAMLDQVKIAAGVREVVALIARPAAIRAAIQRGYHGDPSAFAQLMRGGERIAIAVDRFRSGGGAITGPTPLGAGAVAHDPLALSNAPAPAYVQHGHGQPQAFQIEHGFSGQHSDVLAASAQPYTAPPVAVAHGAAAHAAALNPAVARPMPAPPPPPVHAREPSPVPSPVTPAPAETARIKAVPVEPMPVSIASDYLETLNVLVSLLEASRPELRGHSAQCARLGRKICERMGLPAMQTAAYVAALQLHDIGKAGTYHLTSLNVAEYDGHRTAAQKVYNVPERFLQAVSLHPDTKSALVGMYERFDGKGFPMGTAGKDIPLGARMLAVIDSYADLTANPRNPARKVLKPAEAIQFLARYRGTVFDPTIVDLLKAEVAGDDLRAKLLSDRHSVLLVDPDPEDSTVLELRMLEAGFDVRTARTYQQALHELKTRDVAIVVSDVDLDAEDAGLTLRTAAVAEPWGQKVTAWVIHTRKTDRQLAEIVFDLGVDDLVSKPTPPEVFVTKLRQLVERKQAVRAQSSRGVSGSLAEMALPDVVQILWHGRKTCMVRLMTSNGAGEIAFQDGQIVDARFTGKRGEDAFYSLLSVKDGDFKIETEAHSSEKTIAVSVEGLLLEGMRRLDEGLS
ncbi:MAG: DUF4388 domain-containing protein [Polyangiaceae bacterium]|nr:DUF4388 domain-containing protein [Polyangiaceae bacterium]